MNFDAVSDSLPLYFSGALVTLELLAVSLVIGLVLALPLAVMRAGRIAWLAWPVWAYTYVIRGTPMLVQLFIIYYGLAQFEVVRQSVFWPWLSQAWFCAVLAFAVNTCAYTTEIFAGAIRQTHAGEIEAARSVGMSEWVMLRRILLPSALRRAIPAYSNEVVMMLHGTSLASVVTLMDITGAARETNSRFYAPFEAFIVAGLFYLILTFALVFAFNRAEAKWLKHLAARTN